MLQTDKWMAMGRRAAQKRKPESACPYGDGGTAHGFWLKGYHEEVKAREAKLVELYAQIADLNGPKRN